MLSRRLALAGLGLLLAGCGATPYQPEGMTGGYADRKIDATTWYVEFYGNGYTTPQQVYAFWLYRCAEITVREGFTHFKKTELRAALPRETHFAATRWGGPVPRIPAAVEPAKGGGMIFYPLYMDSGPKPTLRSAIKLLSVVSEEDKDLVFEAKRVLQEHESAVKAGTKR